MTPPTGSYGSTSSKKDTIKRLSKERNVIGIATFVGLRGLDPFLQYGILAKGIGGGLIQKLGGTTLPPGPGLVTRTLLDSAVGLSPYRTILLAMSTASMLKQNATLLAITQEETGVPFAFMVAGFNALFNSLNSLFFVTAQTSPSASELFPQKPLVIGTALFVVGMGIEVVSEAQRTIWKKKPENKGKVYTGGLFSLSRHVNYFGYLLWRSGYALAGGGWVWSGTIAALFWYDFTQRAIPVLQHYLEEKYGEAYEKYEHAVPYRFFPFVY